MLKFSLATFYEGIDLISLLRHGFLSKDLNPEAWVFEQRFESSRQMSPGER